MSRFTSAPHNVLHHRTDTSFRWESYVLGTISPYCYFLELGRDLGGRKDTCHFSHSFEKQSKPFFSVRTGWIFRMKLLCLLCRSSTENGGQINDGSAGAMNASTTKPFAKSNKKWNSKTNPRCYWKQSLPLLVTSKVVQTAT